MLTTPPWDEKKISDFLSPVKVFLGFVINYFDLWKIENSGLMLKFQVLFRPHNGKICQKQTNFQQTVVFLFIGSIGLLAVWFLAKVFQCKRKNISFLGKKRVLFL